MTEEKWLRCNDPAKVLEFLSSHATDRRFWAFVAACARRLPRERFTAGLIRSLDVATRYAEGTASEEELRSHFSDGQTGFDVARGVLQLRRKLVNDANWQAERAAVVRVVRCVFPDPFRSVVFLDEWRTSTAVGLAEGIDESGAFDRLPILADALQDAGCEEEAVLDHCRGGGVHCRGCWVVDGVLGRG